MLPNVSTDGLLLGVIVFIVILLVGGALGFGLFLLIKYLKFNKTCKIFRKVGNEIIPVMNDKGMLQRIGKAGDYWFKFRKFKKTQPRPRKQMAKNEYWFYEREDGELINFTLQDFDENMRKMGAYFVDEDMRLQRLGIQKNLEERFQTVTFWQKYGGLIMNLIFLAVITVLLVFLFREMQGNWSAGQEMAKSVRDMAVQVENMYKRVGSGTQTVNLDLGLSLIRGLK